MIKFHFPTQIGKTLISTEKIKAHDDFALKLKGRSSSLVVGHMPCDQEVKGSSPFSRGFFLNLSPFGICS